MAERAPIAKIGKCLPLTLTKALQISKPSIQKQRKKLYLQKLFEKHAISHDPEHCSLVDFLLQHPAAAQTVQQKYNARWVVVQKQYR